MKKVVVVVLGLLCVFILFILLSINRVNVDDNKAKLRFSPAQYSIEASLDENETSQIVSILDGKKLVSKKLMGELSCGFSSDVSIIIGDDVYEPACDGCEVVYLKTKDKYINLSSEERKIMDKVFTNHGGFFPCIH